MRSGWRDGSHHCQEVRRCRDGTWEGSKRTRRVVMGEVGEKERTQHNNYCCLLPVPIMREISMEDDVGTEQVLFAEPG